MRMGTSLKLSKWCCGLYANGHPHGLRMMLVGREITNTDTILLKATEIEQEIQKVQNIEVQ